jgi:DNA invertase Pin-like site-specific DNA recombinase
MSANGRGSPSPAQHDSRDPDAEQDAGQPLREGVPAASYSRYSSDNQDPASIQQQQYDCREDARARGHVLAPEREFADEAVSGTKPHRAGLDRMLAAAAAGIFRVLYVHCLSRLARETVITLPMLKQLVHVHNVRFISVSERIDSDDPSWELVATIKAFMHQEYLKTLSANVRRGLDDAVRADLSVGDWRYGYASALAPGQEGTARTRQGRPRKVIVIDEREAEWVRRIFHWYVAEFRSMRWIVRALEAGGAPKSRRATARGWSAAVVRKILESPKYVGLWPWRKTRTVRNPLTGVVRQEPRPEAEHRLRVRPHLRLVDDDTFLAAQERLRRTREAYARHRDGRGKLRGPCRDPDRPRHLLQGLVKCAACGGTFKMNNLGGTYLQCYEYDRGACSVRTVLPRALAERMILEAVVRRLTDEPAWVARVLELTRRHWAEEARRRPDAVRECEGQLRDLEGKIEKLLDRAEGEGAPPDVMARVARRREQAAEVARQLARLKAEETSAPRGAPTEAWVRDQLGRVAEVLGGEPQLAGVALRKLIGQVTVREVARPGLKRKKFEGSFRLAPAAAARAAQGLPAGEGATPTADADVITLLFEKVPPWVGLADRVKELYDRGVKCVDMPTELKCPYRWVTLALKHWHESRGLPCPTGSAKRARNCASTKPSKAERVLDRARELYEADWAMQDIEREVGCDSYQLTLELRRYYAARGQAMPDGRLRRRQLRERQGCRPRRGRTAARPPEHGAGELPLAS